MNNIPKSALVLGSTGLIGHHLLQALLSDEYYDKVYAVSRKPILNDSPKLITILADFENVEERVQGLEFDDVYCCLGTTIKKAGSKEEFRKIDYEYPLKVAEVLPAKKDVQFLIVSAMGAKSSSKIFYSQVKGEVEDALKLIKFKALHIFRPSLLLGDREEKRATEKMAIMLFKVFEFAFVGPLKKYKGIEAKKLAEAMYASAKKNLLGLHVHESIEIENIV